MIEFRQKHNLTRKKMAVKCNISTTLLSMLEDSEYEVTHPKIAERVGRVYQLTLAQTESLMPEHYRKSSPNYDPDLYRRNKDELKQITILPGRYK